MKKIIRDGKVGVLISEGYGAGWSTWNQKHGDEVVFAPEIIKLVERNASFDEIEAKAIELWGDEFFCGGITGLTVVWIPKNTKFVITDYDGAESIITEFLEA
jgi:hypothetical protein